MAKKVSLLTLIDGFTALGVKQGMMLEVHCALSSFGYVEGGAHTVICALQQTVGQEGAIVMPSFRLSPNLPLNGMDKDLEVATKIKILHGDERSAMGVVADQFRKEPDVLTGSGIFRVSAWGKDADLHSRGFQHLIDSGGYALLLGVDIYKLSSMHYVEHHLPEVIKKRFEPNEQVRAIYPESDWFVEMWVPDCKPWYTIQTRAYEKGLIADGMVGASKCMLFKVKDVVELYQDALIHEPLQLYGLK